METSRINWKNLVIKLIIIVLLVFIIYKLTQIYTFFKDNKAQLDSDPLVYSARYYNIESCGCAINENVTLFFNKNKSFYMIKSNAQNERLVINFSIFDK